MVGNQYSGKSTIAKYFVDHFGYELIDMKVIQNKIREKLSTEDEPFEGDIDNKEVEKDVMSFIQETTAATSKRVKFIFDGYVHQNAYQFTEFCEKIGKPQFVMNLHANEKAIHARYNLANEAEADAEIGEEALEALKQKIEAGNKDVDDLKNLYAPNAKSMRFLD